jgi:hypothetical protein
MRVVEEIRHAEARAVVLRMVGCHDVHIGHGV